MALSEFRKWLLKKPLCAKVRVVRDDGGAQVVEIQTDKRGGYLEAEATIVTLTRGASGRLEALTSDERTLLRAEPFNHDGDDAAESESDGGSSKKKIEGDNTDRVIQRMGEAIERAYTAGAQAASASQAKLVELVDKLTTHLSIAIENHHRTAAQLASATGDDPQAQMAMQLMGMNAQGGQPNAQQSPSPQQAAAFVSGLTPQNRALLTAALGATNRPTNGG